MADQFACAQVRPEEAMRVAVLGLGYVGTVTAAGLAATGHRVIGVDVDQTKVSAILDGRSPVIEPDIDELLADAVASGRLTATTRITEALSGADVSLVCVGTPSQSSGATDLQFIARSVAQLREAMAEVAPPASGHHVVVVRSTVPPGTVDGLVAPVFSGELPSGWRVSTAMCPEFLREGSSVADFFDPPFVVIGTRDDVARQALSRLFSFCPGEPHCVAVSTAEALKYACNAFHATKVSFANEIARVFRPAGVDAREVMELFCHDTKLNISTAYLRPGFAFGGSCLPKDLRSMQHLARSHSLDVPQLLGTSTTNDLVIRDIVERVGQAGGRHVALFGLTFKADTDDLRESPNVELSERLVGKGYDLRIYDPIVNVDRLHGANLRHVEDRLPHLARLLTTSPETALAEADVAIVSSRDAQALAALEASPPPRIIDLNGRLGAAVEALPGYEGVGW